LRPTGPMKIVFLMVETAEVSQPRELLDYLPSEYETVLGPTLAETAQPAYRAKQISGWVHERFAAGFSEMTDLPANLRTLLDERFSLSPLEMAFQARSRDGTVKHLWRLRDGEQIESVLIPTRDRVTLCLSSQAGCALACRFCATGDFGFRRQLSAAEIVAQFRDAEIVSRHVFGHGIANVVYMGMGEPMANLEAVLTSLSILHGGFGFGARRITVSTVGLIPGIRALADRPEPFRLAVSLHAPEHALREMLVPVEKRYPLPDLFEALRDYQQAKGRRITFEYTMIDRVNDSAELAHSLADLLQDVDGFVNLIPYNPIPGRDWRPSPAARIDGFVRVLGERGVEAAVRRPRGRDIAAACGQLRLERDGLAMEATGAEVADDSEEAL
jgi:23S rRNA (adenine2503-C2)-methyltransferase